MLYLVNEFRLKKEKKKERERQTKKQTHNYREQTDGYQREFRSGDGRNSGWVLKSTLTIMKKNNFENDIL